MSPAKIAVFVIDEVLTPDCEADAAASDGKRLFALCWDTPSDARTSGRSSRRPATLCFGVPPGHPSRETAPFYHLYQMMGKRWDETIVDRESGLAALKRLGVTVSSGLVKMCS
jgi:hypothetical protein